MFLSTIENVLNRGLPRSPRAQQLCATLKGRRIAVDIRGFTRLLVESNGDSLKLTRDATSSAEAELIGGPMALMSLAGPSPEAVIQHGDVEIRGDADLAQAFRELATLLRPDIEEELALLIGDVPAHQLGRFARSALQWGQRAASTTVRNVAEFFAHERGDLVSRPEGNQFLKAVDTLREDVDRLEARIEIIAAQLQALPPGKRNE